MMLTLLSLFAEAFVEVESNRLLVELRRDASREFLGLKRVKSDRVCLT